jgi:hypothetical protein
MNITTASTSEFLDLPDGLAYDDAGDGTLVLRDEFQPKVSLGSGVKTFRLADHASGGAPCRSVS